MNTAAQKHLARALSYIEKGEAFYMKAAEEIMAARTEGATWNECGDELGRSFQWCKDIVAWAKTPANRRKSTPYARSGDPGVLKRNVKLGLKEMPAEVIEQVISELPPERQSQIAAAAGSAHHKSVEKMRDKIRDSDHDFDRDATLGFGPDIHDEQTKLIRKLAEIKAWLEEHGDEMIPDPDGKEEPVSTRELMLGSLASSKGEIDLAFSEVGVGTSIEAGFNRLLSDK
jgi:hypothetical protein